jgi:hypothetical protein
MNRSAYLLLVLVLTPSCARSQSATLPESREGNQLYSQRSGGGRNAIHPLSETEFFFPNSFNRLVVRIDASGRVQRLEPRPRLGMAEPATRISAGAGSQRS